MLSPSPDLIQSPTYSSSVNIPSVTAREALICIPQKNGAKERISREGCQLKKGLKALIKTIQVHISYPNALRPDVFGIQNF